MFTGNPKYWSGGNHAIQRIALRQKCKKQLGKYKILKSFRVSVCGYDTFTYLPTNETSGGNTLWTFPSGKTFRMINFKYDYFHVICPFLPDTLNEGNGSVGMKNRKRRKHYLSIRSVQILIKEGLIEKV